MSVYLKPPQKKNQKKKTSIQRVKLSRKKPGRKKDGDPSSGGRCNEVGTARSRPGRFDPIVGQLPERRQRRRPQRQQQPQQIQLVRRGRLYDRRRER